FCWRMAAANSAITALISSASGSALGGLMASLTGPEAALPGLTTVMVAAGAGDQARRYSRAQLRSAAKRGLKRRLVPLHRGAWLEAGSGYRENEAGSSRGG